jgi:Ca-activated chloride channel family protein
MQVLPASFDFGRVTTGNSSSPLEVTIRNAGTAALNVSSIDLAGASTAGFSLNVAGGARPCGSRAPTVSAGDSCTFQVAFQPSGNATYSSNVRIVSNDSRTPTFDLPLSGTSEAVTALTVRINQVDTMCPSSNSARAHVSVTDQGGFPVSGLNAGAFRLTQSSTVLPITLSGTGRPIAIAALVDNSGSIRNQPVAYNDMKTGFASLFNSMRANDVGELINFGSVFEVTVPFPSPSNPANATNKSALIAGLSVPWSGGTNTLLFDTLYKAIDDTGLQTGYRRAIVVASDGADDQGGTGVPASTRTQAEVIANAVAKGVPIFAIGIGSTVRTAVLQALTSQTGGVYYRANTSQNLATIYQQLSSLLMQSQYELAFSQLSVGSAGFASLLALDVTGPGGATGNASSTITSCN